MTYEKAPSKSLLYLFSKVTYCETLCSQVVSSRWFLGYCFCILQCATETYIFYRWSVTLKSRSHRVLASYLEITMFLQLNNDILCMFLTVMHFFRFCGCRNIILRYRECTSPLPAITQWPLSRIGFYTWFFFSD